MHVKGIRNVQNYQAQMFSLEHFIIFQRVVFVFPTGSFSVFGSLPLLFIRIVYQQQLLSVKNL